ncbi:hypothetical protein RHMOL_Rhmol08G0204500 [Rhododendron molle]|uniref:Uncharacterized protein n=1 Tax=Rhododendron molle TaxID=49168 RepID=A0ACC0MSK0_RHOML|nr:hypothetical protein RHMOL_Rhmol08G0204500 [Rhododendron molle]
MEEGRGGAAEVKRRRAVASGYGVLNCEAGYCGLKVVFAGVLLVSSSARFVVVDFCVFGRRRLRALALVGCVLVVVSGYAVERDMS